MSGRITFGLWNGSTALKQDGSGQRVLNNAQLAQIADAINTQLAIIGNGWPGLTQATCRVVSNPADFADPNLYRFTLLDNQPAGIPPDQSAIGIHSVEKLAGDPFKLDAIAVGPLVAGRPAAWGLVRFPIPSPPFPHPFVDFDPFLAQPPLVPGAIPVPSIAVVVGHECLEMMANPTIRRANLTPAFGFCCGHSVTGGVPGNTVEGAIYVAVSTGTENCDAVSDQFFRVTVNGVPMDLTNWQFQTYFNTIIFNGKLPLNPGQKFDFLGNLPGPYTFSSPHGVIEAWVAVGSTLKGPIIPPGQWQNPSLPSCTGPQCAATPPVPPAGSNRVAANVGASINFLNLYQILGSGQALDGNDLNRAGFSGHAGRLQQTADTHECDLRNLSLYPPNG